MNKDRRRRRMQNALWGLFIGDALAMPVHWYYNLMNIETGFNGGIRTYEVPPHPHPESFMVGMTYRPDVENAEKLGRPYDILHEHSRFYQTTYSALGIERNERESEHGNLTPSLEDRYHYHHGLKKGENTLGAHFVRVLMRSIIRQGIYKPDAFLEDFIDHLTTSGKNRDPYTEIYIRCWFENYALGWPVHACAEQQRNRWSIGSHGGLIRPMVLGMLSMNAYQGLGLAIEHQNLTHRSELVAAALGVLVPLMDDLMNGSNVEETINEYARTVPPPQVTGEALFKKYRDHGGPGNIPEDQVWRLHMDLTEAPLDLPELNEKYEERDVIRQQFANACYPEHGLPLLLYQTSHHQADAEASLLANANAGGDNVHRGMVMGLLVGAATDELPDYLMGGLLAHDELADEIDDFVDIALSGKGI